MKKFSIFNLQFSINFHFLKFQISNFAFIKNFKFQIKNSPTIVYCILTSIILLLLSLSSSTTYAAPRYPVKELGNCRNAKECFLYCEIPQNTPACWAYGKFVLAPKVLGQQTQSDAVIARKYGLTFPIVELGNCATLAECKDFCQQEENQEVCGNFALKKKLIKEIKTKTAPITRDILKSAQVKLGCIGNEGCRQFCKQEENKDKCREFAISVGLYKPGSMQSRQSVANVLHYAQKELGCEEENSCKIYCQQEQNFAKCQSFGHKYNLLSENLQKKKQRIELLEIAKGEFGCESLEDCAKYCAIQENVGKCKFLGNKTSTLSLKNSEGSDSSRICQSESECKYYCQKNPNECAGFQKSPEGFKNQADSDSGFGKIQQKLGDYIGPAGCRNEYECQSYCEKHPDACPDYAKTLKDISGEKETTIESEQKLE